MKNWFNDAFELLARWRTYIANAIAALLIVLPEILNSPEFLGVLPDTAQKWVFLAALLLNIWMRPRPAVLSKDPEADISRIRTMARKRGEQPPTHI